MTEKTEIFLISLQRKTEAVQTSGTEYLQCHHSSDSAEGMTGHFQGSGELAGHSSMSPSCPHPFFPLKQADEAQKQDLQALLPLHGLDVSSILA